MKKLVLFWLAVLVALAVYDFEASAREKVSGLKSDVRVKSVIGSGGGTAIALPVVDSTALGVGVGGANVVYWITYSITNYPDTLGALSVTVPMFDGNNIELLSQATEAAPGGSPWGHTWTFPQGLRLRRATAVLADGRAPTITFGHRRRAADVTAGAAPGSNTLHAAVGYRVETHYE